MDVAEYFSLFAEMKFEDLTDDCAMHILQWVPLSELLRLEITSHRFKAIQEILFRSKKNKLVLLDTNIDATVEAPTHYPSSSSTSNKNPISEMKKAYTNDGIKVSNSYHHLRIDLTKQKNAQLLVEKFPNITQLEIVYDKLQCITAQLLVLLAAWKDTIVHLKIIAYDDRNSTPSSSPWKELFAGISELSALKYLTVKESPASYSNMIHRHQFPNEVANKTPVATLPAPVIARLEEYSFSLTSENASDTFAQLNWFKADSQLRKLALICPYHIFDEFNVRREQNFTPSLDDVDEIFAKQVTDLTLRWYNSAGRAFPQAAQANNEEEALEQLRFINRDPNLVLMVTLTEKFTSVTKLHINPHMDFAKMAPSLATLKQLTELRLPFTKAIFTGVASETTPKAIESLQTLILDCALSSYHNDRLHGGSNGIPHNELIVVDHLVPNLTRLVVNSFYPISDVVCSTCQSYEKVRCREALLASFAAPRFSRLRRVYFLTSDGYSNWEEMHDQTILAKYDVIYLLAGKQIMVGTHRLPL